MIALVSVLTLELPGRAIYHLIKATSSANEVASSGYPESLREQLIHDFDNPSTRVQYEFDMFLGWRARPNQQGLTYRINSAGRRDSIEYSHLSSRLIFLTGGSAAWSLGASDNEHTVSAYLERSINRALHGQERVQVLNLAEQAYGMRQESMTILDYIDMKPALVIFYDGVNDLDTILSGKEPQRYRTYRQFPKILETTLKQVTESTFVLTSHDLRNLSMTWRAARLAMQYMAQRWDSHAQPSPLSSHTEQHNHIKRFFQKQIRLNHQILGAIGVPSLFVIQPISYVDKPINARERFPRYEPEWWQEAYRVLEQAYESLRPEGIRTVSLAHIFHHEERQVYIDSVHVNDLGNQIIGEFLAQQVIALLAHNSAGGK